MANVQKNNHLEMIDWDSEFFGFKVARIISTTNNISDITSHIELAKKNNVKLVYYVSNNRLDAGKLNDLKINPASMVDQKTTFTIDLTKTEQHIKFSEEVTAYCEGMNLNDMRSLSIQSGKYSRYAIDQQFPQELFTKLYTEWIDASIQKRIAKEVLVIQKGGNVSGMITLGEKNSIGDIGLLAVDEASRGHGYGKKLVLSALAWFKDANYKKAQVVTQHANTAACNLYKGCGFSLDKTEYYYHLWL